MNLYQQAIQQRIYAEQFTDPHEYDIAAAMFEDLDMSESADRCRQRAEHYRSLCACSLETSEAIYATIS